MALSWNEIRNRAYAFSAEWKDASSEKAEAQTFWGEFFEVFGISRRRVATFETRVKKQDGKDGYIDLLWKGFLLIEHKSVGSDLDRAHEQATGYFPGLEDEELPRYVLVSDFQRFRIYDMDNHGKMLVEFDLPALSQNVAYFGFMAGYNVSSLEPEEPVDMPAAEKMALLHDELAAVGYTGHHLEMYLVRLLFCLFAEDTGIFERNLFHDLVQIHSRSDGSDLGGSLSQLFHILNTPIDQRLKNLPDHFAAFNYVNGQLFEEHIPPASFSSRMRSLLLYSAGLDWAGISPSIFGSLFQNVIDSEARRNLGAHYTSEENILKVLRPLFLDDLRSELARARGNKAALGRLHVRLSELQFLDPACGCGNFLVVAYRELRKIELDILLEIHGRPSGGQQTVLDISNLLRVSVTQFTGIEIEEFPAQIAKVALWLVDHQMNLKVSEAFGLYYARLPLKTAANIHNEDALLIDWLSLNGGSPFDFIMGNPPFLGHHLQSETQKQNLHSVLQEFRSAGVMDYVSGWFAIAARIIQGQTTKVGFVATNSITQGEQTGILWSVLQGTYGIKIHFAHRTFRWQNEARGNAAVHCTIIGFANFDITDKRLYDYEDVNGPPHELTVRNINAYLLPGPDTIVRNRDRPLCDVPPMLYGSKPTDGGHFILSDEERKDMLAADPRSSYYIKKYLGTREFMNGEHRWVLWLADASPLDLDAIKPIKERVARVRQFRANSRAATTRDYPYHYLFRQVTQPDSDFLLVPIHSSMARAYVPIGFFSPDTIISNACFSIANATYYEFGVLSSLMHMAWMRYTCGRIKSDYRYSKDIVYNNFPWPTEPKAAQRNQIIECAQGVLHERTKHSEVPIGTLYMPLSMPKKLIDAHKALDRAVDRAYRSQPFPNELNRVSYLFNEYSRIIGRPDI